MGENIAAKCTSRFREGMVVGRQMGSKERLRKPADIQDRIETRFSCMYVHLRMKFLSVKGTHKLNVGKRKAKEVNNNSK